MLRGLVNIVMECERTMEAGERHSQYACTHTHARRQMDTRARTQHCVEVGESLVREARARVAAVAAVQTALEHAVVDSKLSEESLRCEVCNMVFARRTQCWCGMGMLSKSKSYSSCCVSSGQALLDIRSSETWTSILKLGWYSLQREQGWA